MENARRTDSFSSNLVLLLPCSLAPPSLSLSLSFPITTHSPHTPLYPHFTLLIPLPSGLSLCPLPLAHPISSSQIYSFFFSSLFHFGFANTHDEFKLEHSRANVMYWEPSMHLLSSCFCVLYNTVIYVRSTNYFLCQ